MRPRDIFAGLESDFKDVQENKRNKERVLNYLQRDLTMPQPALDV